MTLCLALVIGLGAAPGPSWMLGTTCKRAGVAKVVEAVTRCTTLGDGCSVEADRPLLGDVTVTVRWEVTP